MKTHQAILHEFTKRKRVIGGRKNNQFTSLLKCGKCSKPLWRQGNGSRLAEDRYTWRCSKTGSATGHVNISHSEVLRKVVEGLTPILANQVPRKGVRQWDGEQTDLKDYDGQIADLVRQLERLETGYLQGAFELDRYITRKRRLEEELAVSKAEKDNLLSSRSERNAWLMSIKKLKARKGNHFETWIRTHDPAEVNHKLKLIIEKIIVTEKKGEGEIEIVMKK